MRIQVGAQLPNIKLHCVHNGEIQDVTTGAYFAGKRSLVFALPGAYTPVCSTQHLPSYVQNRQAIQEKGYDQVVCISVNDPFVLKAWAQDQDAVGKVDMLADGSAEFTKAIGLDIDLHAVGLGLRSHRYVMSVTNGVVESLDVEASPAQCTVSQYKD